MKALSETKAVTLLSHSGNKVTAFLCSSIMDVENACLKAVKNMARHLRIT